MIVGKNQIFIGSSDSHKIIKKENNLNDNFPIEFVPIEIYPDDLDFSKDPKYWKLHTDLSQSDWPDWYSEEEAQEACRRKIQSWKNNLKTLYCWDTEIKKLPELKNLKYLYCNNTNIKEIPKLPNLEVLNCNNTKIKGIPKLPNLEILYCRNTKIKDFSGLSKNCEIYK